MKPFLTSATVLAGIALAAAGLFGAPYALGHREAIGSSSGAVQTDEGLRARASGYYEALKVHDYKAAYSYLSVSMRRDISKDQFTETNKASFNSGEALQLEKAPTVRISRSSAERPVANVQVLIRFPPRDNWTFTGEHLTTWVWEKPHTSQPADWYLARYDDLIEKRLTPSVSQSSKPPAAFVAQRQ